MTRTGMVLRVRCAAVLALVTVAPFHAQEVQEQTAEETAITQVVANYVRGWREADVELLRTVFATDGVILWPGGDVVNRLTFGEALERRRPNPGYGEPWRMLSLRVVDGTVALAEVLIAGGGDTEYTDLLTLYRLDGGWRIVVKTYSARSTGDS